MMVPEKVGRFDSKLFVQGNSIALIIAKPHADYIRIIPGDIVTVRIAANGRNTAFEGTTFIGGNSMALVVPKPCANYLGVMAGDMVTIKISRVKGRIRKNK